MQQFEWIATAAFGLEGVVARELERLGITAKAENGGARFAGTWEDAMRANLWLRCADRVLLVMGRFEARSFEELFEGVRALPWEDIIGKNTRFPVSGKCARSQLMSVRDCQAITKKAIVERLKRAYKINWFEETGAEYAVDVSLHGDVARLAIDTSGTALNRRGYRTWNGEAPLRETLAAALVMLSPCRDDRPLWDACCGTGTLLIEAAYWRAHRAPGLTRGFACEKWPLFPAQETARIRAEAESRVDLSRIGMLGGSDIDKDALKLCKRHVQQAGLGGRVTITEKDLRTLKLDAQRPFFLMNPPYGERLGDRRACEKLYHDLRLLYDRHAPCGMGVITAHTGFERCFGKRAAQKRRLYNGRLECEYLLYGDEK